MTLTQITLFFLGIMAVILTAMMVHNYLDKNRMTKNLRGLTVPLSGTVLWDAMFDYPRFEGTRDGRKCSLLFNVVKVGRQHILYSICSMATTLPHALLLIKKDAYKPVADEAEFTEANGTVLMGLNLPFQGRSNQPEWATRICNKEGVADLLSGLDAFSSLQFGPDALIIGKPYEGDSDMDPDSVVHQMDQLAKLAALIEQCPA
jgi:hypothetical protein